MNALVPQRVKFGLRHSGLLAIATFLSTAGCAIHEQVQYFAAKDQDTGAINYYRLKVSGAAGWGTDYHMQAGYFSTAAVDILRGQMPNIPDLDLPVEQIEVVDRLMQQFYANLIQEAKRVAPISDPEALSVAIHSRQSFARERADVLEAQRSNFDSELTAAESKKNALSAAVTALDGEVQKLVKEVADREASLQVDITRRASINGEVERINRGPIATNANTNGGTPADSSSNGSAPAAPTDANTDTSSLRTELTALDARIPAAQASLQAARNSRDERKAALRDARSQFDSAQRAIRELTYQRDMLAARLIHMRSAESAAAQLSSRIDANSNDPMIEMLAKPGENIAPKNSNDLDSQIIQLARLVWFGTLSTSDVASIGMLRSTDHYVFRKLVFWSTARNLDINNFSTEIDGIIANVVGIAQSYKQIGKERELAKLEKKQADAARQAELLALLEKFSPSDQRPAVDSLRRIMEGHAGLSAIPGLPGT